MNILFVHRSFPAQFKYIATYLSLDSKNKVMFITTNNQAEIEGVNKLVYKPQNRFTKSTNPYLQNIEDAVIHGQAAAGMALEMKKRNIKPDIIYGFSGWGSSMFMKDVFPDVPMLSYFEWFRNTEITNLDIDGTILDEERRGRLRCNNAHVLFNLTSCDAGISPTNWQKSQFPKEFQNKIQVIHDGIDTGYYKPDESTKLIIKDINGKDLELTSNDEIITYGTRGMEPCRGFPEFMRAAKELSTKRPNAHILIAGDDVTCYNNSKIEEETYKELAFKELDSNMDRVHFIGKLPLTEYLKFLQISSVHVYLTQPFVLSWSILEAMSTGCCVVASNTEPVLEVVEDNFNGLLVNHSNIDEIVEKVEYAIDNKKNMQCIRKNARQTIIDKYDLMKILPQQIELIQSLIRK